MLLIEARRWPYIVPVFQSGLYGTVNLRSSVTLYLTCASDRHNDVISLSRTLPHTPACRCSAKEWGTWRTSVSQDLSVKHLRDTIARRVHV
jgi:hypothetical protein